MWRQTGVQGPGREHTPGRALDGTGRGGLGVRAARPVLISYVFSVYIYIYMHQCMYVCMYVYMYIYIYIHVYILYVYVFSKGGSSTGFRGC